MLNVDLKEHTREDHAALEKKLLQRIHAIDDPNDYVVLLRLLYGYYYVIESRLAHFLEVSDVPDFSRRRKAHKILEDISVFVPEVDDAILCDEIPEINSYHAALGAMYVLEGSTLGGQIIARIIEGKLQADAGFRFFRSYNAGVGEMWKEFQYCLQKPFTEREKLEILQSAKQTFITFNNWLSDHD